MNNISQHICYLLRHHDCVVLPGWGAFVAQRCSAVIDAETGKIYPPRRVLGFNADIKHDDGLVASSVARRDGVGYNMAMQQVNETVDVLRRQLATDRELYLPGLGMFTMSSEDAVVFEPSNQNVASLPLSVLPDVSVVSVREAAKIQAEENTEVVIHSYTTISRRWMKVAASLVLLLGLGLVLSTPIAIPDAVRASLAAPAITIASQDALLENFELSDANKHGVLSIVIPNHSDAMAVVDTVKVANSQDVTLTNGADDIRMNDTDDYCVIVASLASRALAQEYIDQVDEPMSVLEKDGKYRVYVATGTTYTTALNSARQARLINRYPEAWVCHR